MNVDSLYVCREVELSYGDLHISDEELFRTLNCNPTEADAEFLSIVHRLRSQVGLLCRPRFGYRLLAGSTGQGKVTLLHTTFQTGAIISHQLREGELFAILIASVGAEMDEWLHKKQSCGDVVEAFISDALGSVVAEAIIEWGRDYIEHSLTTKGLKVSNTYSPGYCGWNVIEQHQLFDLLPSGFCGVSLCRSGLMLPIKSISAISSVGRNVVKRDYGCALCQKKDCFKRRLK